eukprot:RCo051036
MPRSLCLLLLGLVVLNLLTTYVKASNEMDDEEGSQEESAEDEDSGTSAKASVLEDEGEAEGLTTYCIFPRYPQRKFPAGEVVESLIGFENLNNDKLHVEYIRGSLTSPVDFTFYIYNFTGAMHNTTAASGDEHCLLYRFRADPSIEPRQYGMILQVFYTSDDNETFLSTVFNNTIEITSASSFDGKSVFAYLTVLGVLGMAGYGGYTVMNKNAGKRSSRSGASASSGRTSPKSPTAALMKGVPEGVDVEWIPEEHLQIAARMKMPGRRASNSPPRRESPHRRS